MKASMNTFQVVTSMDVFVEAFVDVCVNVTFVEAFKSCISFKQAIAESFVNVSVQIASVKSSITSANVSIATIKASV